MRQGGPRPVKLKSIGGIISNEKSRSHCFNIFQNYNRTASLVLIDTMSSSSRSSSSPSPLNKHSSPLIFSQSPSPSRNIKRKRDDDDGHETAVAKPAKSKKSKKAKKNDDENLDLKSGLNVAIGKLDSQLLADYIAQRTKRFSPNLSLVELEDFHIPGNYKMAMSGHIC